MNWQNPLKTVRLCFFETGHMSEHFASVDDEAFLDRLVSFLKSSNTVIAHLDNVPDHEIETLKNLTGRDGRSLFAAPGCFDGHSGFRTKCARVCPLKD